MSRSRCIVIAIVAIFPATVHADEFIITLPGTAVIPSTPSTPYTVTSANLQATTGLLGYSLRGNWTAGPGDPWSSELVISLTPPGGSASTEEFVGGVTDGNPFTFGNGINNGIAFNVPGTPLPNFAAGNHTVSLYQIFEGSTAFIDGGEVSVFSNPSSVSATTAGGPTFTRPDIGTGPAEGPVNYATNSFTVATAGRYMIVNDTQYDSVVLLYQNSFDPLNPLNNLVNAGDYDFPPYEPFGDTLVADLTAGTTYIAVSTGHFVVDSGAYTVFVAGPGLVTFTPVPEPGTTLLVSGTVLTAGVWLRRKWARRGAKTSHGS